MTTPPFTVRRSVRARRARVTVAADGRVVVVLPTRAPDSLADQLVVRHADWIERHRRRIADVQAILGARPAIGEGRELSLRGLPHDVFVERAANGRRSSVSREAHSAPVIVVRVAPGDNRPPQLILESWLRRLARSDVSTAVALRAPEMAVQPARIAIRDQRTRWGSASRRGTLSFSWRLVLCPPEILDYVIVHELAHLALAGHSPRFWAIVARHAPAADHARRWLRRHEAALRHAPTDQGRWIAGVVEMRGLEPLTPAMRTRCSPS